MTVLKQSTSHYSSTMGVNSDHSSAPSGKLSSSLVFDFISISISLVDTDCPIEFCEGGCYGIALRHPLTPLVKSSTCGKHWLCDECALADKCANWACVADRNQDAIIDEWKMHADNESIHIDHWQLHIFLVDTSTCRRDTVNVCNVTSALRFREILETQLKCKPTNAVDIGGCIFTSQFGTFAPPDDLHLINVDAFGAMPIVRLQNAQLLDEEFYVAYDRGGSLTRRYENR